MSADSTCELKKEEDFFDRVYSSFEKEQEETNFIVPEEFIRHMTVTAPNPISDREYSRQVMGEIDSKSLLDYGAGDGWNSICFAKGNARVWAIDISSKGVELIKKKAHANHVSELITAEVRNCYDTGFSSEMFDIIYGGGVLHHLDIELAAMELAKILKQDGVAVFSEPIRETRAMDIIKSLVLAILRRKPSEETENETPLNSGRIALLKAYFKTVNYRQFNILSSANVLIKSKALKRALLFVDYVLIRIIPGFEKLGRTAIIELRQPIKSS